MGLLDPVGMGLNSILGEDTVSKIPLVGGLLGAQSDAEKALIRKQKQMASEAAARKQQQALTSPQMNVTAQSMLAFNPLNQKMAQTHGAEAAFTPQQFADMVRNPQAFPGIDDWARAQKQGAPGAGSMGGFHGVVDRASGGQLSQAIGGQTARDAGTLVNYKGTDPKIRAQIDQYIREKQQFEQAEERRRQMMLQGMQQPGPGPAPLGPRAAPAPVRRF